ncbi:MAG: hypothetical protein QM651_19855 [Rhodoblastus sp.]
MWRLALLLWVMGGTVLAGIAVTVVLLVPAWYAMGMRTIPIAAAIGALVAIPLAVAAARTIAARTREA